MSLKNGERLSHLRNFSCVYRTSLHSLVGGKQHKMILVSRRVFQHIEKESFHINITELFAIVLL